MAWDDNSSKQGTSNYILSPYEAKFQNFPIKKIHRTCLKVIKLRTKSNKKKLYTAGD